MLRDENLKYLTFVINRTPQVVRLASDPDEHLAEVPSPLGKRPMMNASSPDRSGEHRTESVPPEPNGFMANIDATLEQNIFYLPKRQWIADVHHNHEANHLGRAVEMTKWIAQCRRLRIATPRLKPICSDKAGRNALRHRHSAETTKHSLYERICGGGGTGIRTPDTFR